jgi:predicted phage baseplate assembly protein
MINFSPTTTAAAQVDLTLTITGAVGKVLFEAGEVIASTQEVTDPILFQLLADITFDPALSTDPLTGVTFENSETVDELFEATGLPFQEARLAQTPFIDTSLVIAAQNGAFTEVDDFLASTATDKHFRVEVDQNDRATVIFPDGIQGQIPTGTIEFTYNIGGGKAGEVELGTVTKLDRSFADEFGNAVTVTVTNPAKASGGQDRQNVKQIQEAAPLSLRALTRSVAREDFEINALRLAGVARALMLTSNEDSIPENTGVLFPIPTGGGLPTQALKDLVLAQFIGVDPPFPSTLTFTVLVQDPVFLTVNVSAVVFLAQGVTPATARTAINTALTDFFELQNEDGTTNTNIDFGFNLKKVDGTPADEIAWSNVHNIVRDLPEVRKVDPGPIGFLLNGLRDDLAIERREFPVLGTVSLINGATGLAL